MVSLIAKKSDSTVMFGADGRAEHVTLLHVDGCVVLGVKSLARDGYDALVLAASEIRRSLVAKPQLGIFDRASVSPRKVIKEFRTSGDNYVVGSGVLPSSLGVGDLVDVSATSKGKGFAGVMKRHNFRGLEATHGVSVSHRSHGSTGHRTYPSKVFKGKRMAGHMGSARVTVRNLKVIYVDDELGVVGVRGAVPGPINGYVTVVRAKAFVS